MKISHICIHVGITLVAMLALRKWLRNDLINILEGAQKNIDYKPIRPIGFNEN